MQEKNVNNTSSTSASFHLETHQLSITNANYSIVCGASYTLNPSVIYVGDKTVIYTWDTDSTLSATNIKNPIANPLNFHNYKLSATDGVCSANGSFDLTVNPLTVNSGSDKTIICGGKIQFDNPISNYTGSGTLAYSWLPKTGLDSATLARPTAEITTPSTYVLEVISPKGCKATDSIKIIVNPLTINSGSDKTIICGGKIQFDNPISNYTGSGTLAYSWLPKTGL
ncbi:MAG: hypothetical protein NT150_00410, partial [Bacteroidetes bacterium]|nr:hypothetical protein [Bacteroidota bacterium]